MRRSRCPSTATARSAPAGDVSSGELEAANESEIVDRLRDQGLMPMQIAQALGAAGRRRARVATRRARRWFAPKRVTRDNVLGITRELATLLRAGLPLDRALELLISARADAAGRGAAAGRARRRARRQVAVAGARRAARGVLALLRQHRARRRSGRRARRGAAAARRNDGAQQGAARIGALGAHLSDDPDLRRRRVGDGAADRSSCRSSSRRSRRPARRCRCRRRSSSSSARSCATGGGRRCLPSCSPCCGSAAAAAMPSVRRVRDARLLRTPLLGDLIAKVEIARFARTLATLLANGVTLLAGLVDRQGDDGQRRAGRPRSTA